MKLWNVVFSAKALVKSPVGTISRCETIEDNDGLYRGTLHAVDPDDALFRISEAYRGATVRHVWVA